MALSSKKLLLALKDMLAPYPCPSHVATPMLPDSPVKMRDVGEPVCQDLIHPARQILGLGLFIVRGTRPDALFAAVALSPYIVNNLTPYV